MAQNPHKLAKKNETEEVTYETKTSLAVIASRRKCVALRDVDKQANEKRIIKLIIRNKKKTDEKKANL